MDKTHQHNQTPGDRAACSHLRRIITKMKRSERLAVAVILTTHCFDEVNKLNANSIEIQEFGIQGEQAFNENLRDIRTALSKLPTRDIAEIVCSIMLPELTTSTP